MLVDNGNGNGNDNDINNGNGVVNYPITIVRINIVNLTMDNREDN